MLDEGKQVFYGTREQARPFMEEQGFVCSEGANVADFLTGVTVPSERQIRPGFEGFPRNNIELEQAYQRSSIKASSPMTVSFYDQVKACVARQYQILWGDKATFIIKQGSTLFQALVSFCLCLRTRLLLTFTL